jgi:hypothetical protein
MLRRFVIWAALGTTLILPLAGCGTVPVPTTGVASTAPTALPPPDPVDVLAAAASKTTGVNLNVELTDSTGNHYTGSYDGIQKIASLTQAGGGTGLKITVTREDYYLSGLKTYKGQTVHLKIDKLRDESILAVMSDVLIPLTLLSQATGVRSTGPGAYSGHIDASLVRGTTLGAQKFLAHVNRSGGANAQTLIFTATVKNGYLTSFKTTLPTFIGGKDVTYELKLSNFGIPVTITIPTGKTVIEPPDKLYETI